MSHCQHLAVAAATPFDPRAIGAQLHTDSPASTQAISQKIVFDGGVGSDGVGMIMFNPAIVNDRVSCWYTSASTTQAYSSLNGPDAFDNTCTAFSWLTNAPTVQFSSNASMRGKLSTATFSGLPYSTSDLSNGLTDTTSSSNSFYAPNVRGRLVASGLKITFSGSTLNDQGMFYNFVDPVHENLNQSFGTGGYSSSFLSLKPQRIAQRGMIEQNIMPVTRAMQELSDPLDELVICSPNCLLGSGQTNQNMSSLSSVTGNGLGTIFMYNGLSKLFDLSANGGYFPSGTAGANVGLPLVGIANIQEQLRALVSLLYPASRRNAACYLAPECDASGNAITRTCNIATTTGVVTWTVGAPQQQVPFLGQMTTGTAGWDPFLMFVPVGGVWYARNGSGLAVSGNLTGVNVVPVVYMATPPIVGGVYLTGLAPGTTFHVEMIVHVEYSGKNVQGRTLPVVMDQKSTAIIQQGVQHAREIAGSREMATVGTAFGHALLTTAASHAPQLAELAISAVLPEAAPALVPAVQAISSVLGRSLGKRSRHHG